MQAADQQISISGEAEESVESDPDPNLEKWSCEFCTYENFKASIRCSMCRAPRTPTNQLICENQHNQIAASQPGRRSSTASLFATADIFKLGASTTTASTANSPITCPSSPTPTSHFNNNNNNNTNNNHIQNHKMYQQSRSSSPQVNNAYIYSAGQLDQEHASKWACQACTFLNWPRALRCSQCLVPRRRVSPVVSRNSPMSPRPSGGGSGQTSPGSPPPSNHGHPPMSDLQICITDRQTTTSSPSLTCITPPPLSSPPPPTASALTSSGTPSTPTLSGPTSIQASFGAMKVSSPKLYKNNNRNIICQDSRGFSPPPSTATTTSSPNGTINQKWSCPECTYDNWPRTRRCVLCGTVRAHKARQDDDDVVTVRMSSPSEHQPPQGGSYSRETPSPQGASYSKPVSVLNNSDTKTGNNFDHERRLRQLRRRQREADWNWLAACMGVFDGDMNPVEAYLNFGGDVTRKLTNPEVVLLNRPNIFEAGHTLVHLAIKLHREDMLATLLSQLDNVTGGGSGGGVGRGIKCVPSYVAPDLASAIRRHISSVLRQLKGSRFPCYFINEFATYTLPPEIEDLPPATQEQLYSELLDRDAQRELEEESNIINWSPEVQVRLGSRLHALWNRSAGDCLLDSVMQATWGVFDRDNTLRRAMSDSLHEAGHIFYPRWKEWEIQQALELDYTLDEGQLAEDWATLLNLASQPGASLEHLHVFCLAHVLRRPIIIYGVKYVKSWRGENIGFARFEGVYLPLLWDPSHCSTSPIALGYTRGHFCALVPPEPALGSRHNHLHSAPPPGCGRLGAATATSSMFCCSNDVDVDEKCTYLPLTTSADDGKQILPIHFLSDAELGNEEMILRQWLDVCVTDSGLIVARQKVGKPPLLVAQMTEEWLNHYRKLAQSTSAPFASRTATGSSAPTSSTSTTVTSTTTRSSSNQCYSSDGDSDDE